MASALPPSSEVLEEESLVVLRVKRRRDQDPIEAFQLQVKTKPKAFKQMVNFILQEAHEKANEIRIKVRRAEAFGGDEHWTHFKL